MTSIVRSQHISKTLPKPQNVIHPVYYDGANDIAAPFTFNKQNGTLDFDFTGGFSASTSINGNNAIYIQGSAFSGLHAVTRLGANFIAWCEDAAANLGGNAADPGSVVLYKSPIVVRANQVGISFDPNSVDSFQAGLTTPADFETAAGSPSLNNYYTTYLFRTPLVISYTVSGTVNYAIFNTQYEGNS